MLTFQLSLESPFTSNRRRLGFPNTELPPGGEQTGIANLKDAQRFDMAAMQRSIFALL